MKKFSLYLTIIFCLVVGMTSCSYNELPPKTDDVSSYYLLPKGEVPSQEERDLVDAAKKEYSDAIKNK